MIRTPALASAAAAGLLLACTVAGPAAASVGTLGADSSDASFLKAVHQGNLAEITSGADAYTSATTSCVQRIGAVLVRDHTVLDAIVKALASTLHLRLPNTPNAAQLNEFAKVMGSAGTRAYDTGWLRMQALGHEQTLALLDREIFSADRADLAAAARRARPIVARHLVMVQACGAPAPAPGPVRAGLGGTATTGHDLGMPLLAVGTVVAASGAGWVLRKRRITV